MLAGNWSGGISQLIECCLTVDPTGANGPFSFVSSALKAPDGALVGAFSVGFYWQAMMQRGAAAAVGGVNVVVSQARSALSPPQPPSHCVNLVVSQACSALPPFHL